MKKVPGILILVVAVLAACSKRQPPEDPVDQKELIIGKWASQRSFRVLTVGGQSTEAFDSITPGTTLEFTENFNYYGYLEADAVIASLAQLDLADTGRYNLHRDTIFLIKDALAFDTLLVRNLDEMELEIIFDFFTKSIGGQLVTQETVMSFQRQPAIEPEEGE